MFKYIKNRLFALFVMLFASFYFSYAVTVGYQIFKVHEMLIEEQKVGIINFGIITFIIFAFLPVLIWKMVADSDIPILKETLGIRFLLSELAIIFTISLFFSKIIFNSIAKPVMDFESDVVLDLQGRIVLIEVLSIAVPTVIFLYLSKKVVSYFMKKFEE